jgi:8-oxo-dGTP pyrophosphatase MutT (NUDIX family)
MPAVLKVLIYGTWQGRVLVFDEPDFPDLALQVPGGTVEAGEDVVTAAAREFFEETGIAAPVQPRLLMQADYRFERDGQSILHHRHFFHLPLEGAFPEAGSIGKKRPSMAARRSGFACSGLVLRRPCAVSAWGWSAVW